MFLFLSKRLSFILLFSLQLCYFATIEKHLVNDNHLTNSFVFHISAKDCLMCLVKMCYCASVFNMVSAELERLLMVLNANDSLKLG